VVAISPLDQTFKPVSLDLALHKIRKPLAKVDEDDDELDHYGPRSFRREMK
jgi:hypothetical protein